MIIKDNIYIPYLNLDRSLHIYIPDYKKQKRFPVLYMFDGHNLFFDEEATYGKSWGLKKYLEKKKIQMIVVGIECNHENNERLNEFSPYSFQDDVWGEIKASGKQFLDWMSVDLKKYIDAQYPTLKSRKHTYLGGSSMGGLMALYGGSIYHKTYSKAICISIFMEYIMKELKQDIEQIEELKESIFYISFGQREFRNKRSFAIGCEKNLSVSRLLQNKKAEVYMHCFLNGGHNEASWEKEIPIFMKEILL